MIVIKKIFKWIFKIALIFIVLSNLWVLIYKFLPVPYTYLMAKRSFENNVKTQYKWTKADNMNRYILLAAVVSEDQNFFKHNGFDWGAIKKARAQNKKGKKLRGASTLSQQVAKNVFLWPNRSYLRKGLEVYFTVLIEFWWSKKRILEVYLNVAEMGKGIYGVGAASKAFFNKEPARISKQQCAQLIAVLPSPQKWNAKNPGPYVYKRSSWIQQQVRFFGGIKYLDDKI